MFKNTLLNEILQLPWDSIDDIIVPSFTFNTNHTFILGGKVIIWDLVWIHSSCAMSKIVLLTSQAILLLWWKKLSLMKSFMFVIYASAIICFSLTKICFTNEKTNDYLKNIYTMELIIDSIWFCFYANIIYNILVATDDLIKNVKRGIMLMICSNICLIFRYGIIDMIKYMSSWMNDQYQYQYAAFLEAFSFFPWTEQVISVGFIVSSVIAHLFFIRVTMRILVRFVVWKFIIPFLRELKKWWSTLTISFLIAVFDLFDGPIFLFHFLQTSSFANELMMHLFSMTITVFMYKTENLDQVNVESTISVFSPPMKEVISCDYVALKYDDQSGVGKLKPRYAWMKFSWSGEITIKKCLITSTLNCFTFSVYFSIASKVSYKLLTVLQYYHGVLLHDDYHKFSRYRKQKAQQVPFSVYIVHANVEYLFQRQINNLFVFQDSSTYRSCNSCVLIFLCEIGRRYIYMRTSCPELCNVLVAHIKSEYMEWKLN